MVRPVELPPALEQEVRFVEDTSCEQIVDATIERLRDGRPAGEMLAAACLAVSRSTELPPDHHGGPVHPVSGIHAIYQLASRLGGDSGYLPVVQSVALANKHVNSPDMGPALMPALDAAPLAGTDTAALLAGFAQALADRQSLAAERHLLALLPVAAPGQILDAMLQVALPRNALDDHHLLYPIYAFRALDDLGWDWAPVVLRPPVRYLARHPMMEAIGEFSPQVVAEGLALYQDFAAIERMIDDHGLSEDSVAMATDASESAAVGELAERIGQVQEIRSIIHLLAEALAEGLSLAGAGEALSIGGGLLFLRCSSGNPFEVHIHTGINARRYLLGLEGVGFRTKVLGLLTWSLGMEVRYLDPTLTWMPGAPPEVLAELPARGQGDLLAAIAESILTQPVVDLETIEVSVDELVAADQVRDTIALAQQYAAAGYDPEPYFELLGRLTCQDDQSEMHAYKLQQVAYEEYFGVREPYRWVHMVSAARHAACVVNLLPKTVYPAAQARLAH
jgi:hypothetical protein